MKISFLFVFLILLTGCSSSFNLVDNRNNPIDGAIVVSEIDDYIFQKWTVQVDVTNLEGEANALVGREAVYKKGFHPIVRGNDTSEVNLKTISLRGNVKLYPVKKTPKYKYYLIKRFIKIQNPPKKQKKKNHIVNIDVKHCMGVKATYSDKDELIKIESNHRNLLKSRRFFYERASSHKESELSNNKNISFYCLNNNQSIYKTGISLRLIGSVRTKTPEGFISTYLMTMLRSRITNIDAYIEPEVKPTHPLRGRFVANYKSKFRFPKVVLLKSKETILRAIEENIPLRTEEEREFKRLLLLAVQKNN